MAVAQIENLLLKARQTPQEEIDALCSSIGGLLSLPDKSAECCALLRHLFLILQTSKSDAEPFVSPELIKSIVQVLVSYGSQSSKILVTGNVGKCSLCQMILTELFPHDAQDEILNGTDSDSISPKLVDLIVGKKSKCFDQIIPQLTRWLQSQDLEKQMSGLAILTSLNMLHANSLNHEQINTTSERMAQWLSSAGVLQAPNPYAVNPFRKDEESHVTEIDGSTNVNIFTALNIGQYYTDDQLMNIYSFSMLYKWLKAHKVQSSEDKDGGDSSQLGDNRKTKYPSENAIGSLIAKSVDYCFRVIEQCERKVKVQSDSEFQVACLLEAVQVLDTICFLDQNQIARVFQEIKRLNVRLQEDKSLSPVLVPVLKYLFNHSNFVVHDPQHTFHHFFSVTLSERFKDQGLMYDVIDFLYTHQEEVLNTTDIFSKYFPNLFKILAWYPRVFLNEFCILLPSMINWTTAVEIFHLLLDLPCITAALEVIERAKKSEPVMIPIDADPSNSVEAYNSPRLRPLFSYIVRGESGQGDTIDRLSSLHTVLKDCTNSKRVLVCCQVVPILLKVWFDTVIECEDADFTSTLIPVILERFGLLFDIPPFIEDIQMVMSEKILMLCKEYPEIVTKEREEIRDFLHATSNIQGRVSVYANLIYVVGEYTSSLHCSDCTSEVIGKYYESLEVTTYELLAQLTLPDPNPNLPKIISALISTLAKLASRCQDLIPRAILSLTKVAKVRGHVSLPTLTSDTLIHRATALMAVLKNPESAGHVLNPSADIYSAKWHLNNTSKAAILRSMHRLIKE